MGREQPQFAAVHTGVPVRNLRLALSQRLHFAARQNEATFQCVEDFEVVTGPSIRGDDAVSTGGVSLRLVSAFLHLLRTSHALQATQTPRRRRQRH